MEKIKKIISIMMSLLLVTTIFSVSFSLNAIQATAQEQLGCCLETGPLSNKQCVTTTRAECQGRFYTGPPYDCSNVPECKPGTCIPKDKSQECMRNKHAAECIAMGGVPDPNPLESIPQCKPGCCIIAKGVKAEVLQFRQCENLTKTLGYDLDMMEFKEGVTSQVECKKIGSPSDLGCCTLGGGECKYGTRAECGENVFVPLAGGLFCRDVAGCALTSHNYKDCGKLPGTETDIYWFDSQGNQEEMYESCNYPEKICQKSPLGIAYCKDTRCDLSDALGSQNMTSNPPTVKKIEVPTKYLLSGTSICYNFYSAYGDDRFGTDDDTRRSTGLQNQIIHCSFGKIEIEGLGVDRQKLCVPANASVQGPGATFHTNVKINRWQNCSQCGGQGGLLGEVGNAIGDYLGPSYNFLTFPSGKMFSELFGDYCTKEKCEALGDCYYHEDLGGWPRTTPLGGTPVGSCDPIYPPGGAESKCYDCGGGGDALWNLCTRAECYSKGDCQFQGASWYTKLGTFNWFWPGLAFSERIKLIIPECLITGWYCKGCPPACKDIACLHPNNKVITRCLWDRTKAYVVGMPIWIVQGKLMEMAWGAFSGKVSSTIVDSAMKGIFGGGGGGGQQQQQQGGGGS